jgi:hypothetical protein
VRLNNPQGGLNANFLTGFSVKPPLGSQPALGPVPAINHKVACDSQSVPNLNGPAGQPGPPSPAVAP